MVPTHDDAIASQSGSFSVSDEPAHSGYLGRRAACGIADLPQASAEKSQYASWSEFALGMLGRIKRIHDVCLMHVAF